MMRSAMKRSNSNTSKYTAFAAMFAMMMTAATATQAQPGNQNHVAQPEAAIENYQWSLQNGNAGVVESTLHNLVRFRSAYPKAEMETINEALKDVSMNAANPGTRYKAYMVYMTMQEPEMAKLAAKYNYNQAFEMYEFISKNMELNNFAHQMK